MNTDPSLHCWALASESQKWEYYLRKPRSRDPRTFRRGKRRPLAPGLPAGGDRKGPPRTRRGAWAALRRTAQLEEGPGLRCAGSLNRDRVPADMLLPLLVRAPRLNLRPGGGLCSPPSAGPALDLSRPRLQALSPREAGCFLAGVQGVGPRGGSPPRGGDGPGARAGRVARLEQEAAARHK